MNCCSKLKLSQSSSVLTDQVSVMLVGNPNTGKTTIFNCLTGTRHRVGNYPGVTVEKREGKLFVDGNSISVVDLPGTYSLSAASPDERIVVDCLSGRISEMGKPSVVVCVVDGTNLSRNLYLASQVADTGIPLVIALNMSDEVKSLGCQIDCKNLAELLGVPVVPTVAAKGIGIEQLRGEIVKALANPQRMKKVQWPEVVQRGCLELKSKLKAYLPADVSDAEIKRLLFDSNGGCADRFSIPKETYRALLVDVRETIEGELHENPTQVEPTIRFRWISEIVGAVCIDPSQDRLRLSDKIDSLLVHRIFGPLIFFAIMFLVFQSIYTIAGPFMELIEYGFTSLGEFIAPYLDRVPVLQSLVVDGIIAGVGSILVFLPQIMILFLFIAILEDSGYMARAAFLMDKIFSWCGLDGKCFVPLLSSYACSVPGVMAARTIDDSKSRLVTILIAPLMSCSARLPVYVLMIGAFIEPAWGSAWAGFVLFAMYFLGLFIAIPVAFLLSRCLLFRKKSLFVLEIPPYRMPTFKNVVWRMIDRAKSFVIRAGTLILCMSIIVWALCYFPHPESVGSRVEDRYFAQMKEGLNLTKDRTNKKISNESQAVRELENLKASAYIEQSYMGRLGRFVQPLFAPAGFDWRITVAILASFPAREVVISTLGIIYNLGSDVSEDSSELVAKMRASSRKDGSLVFSPILAIGIMVFFALCMQCGATLAVIMRESSLGWALFAFCYMTVLAWCGAVTVHQLSLFF